MIYREKSEESMDFKQKYLDGLMRVLESRQDELTRERDEYVKDIFTDPDKYRKALSEMFGWPLNEPCSSKLPRVTKTMLSREEGYTLYRMSFEVLPGLDLTGLYFEIDTDEKRPLVLVQHGGLGTPEMISGVYGGTGTYHQILTGVVERGVNAFAPQLMLWAESFGVPCDRRGLDARLKRVGSSITAVEVHGLMRVLDYFEATEKFSCFGMIGLSYGGFYTLVTSALDTRIKSAISCSFFNTREKYSWTDWTWFNAGARFDDAEIACLVYPRELCIEIGERDALFDVKSGIESYKRLARICEEKQVGTDWVKFITFDGEHEFNPDDKLIEELTRTLMCYKKP